MIQFSSCFRRFIKHYQSLSNDVNDTFMQIFRDVNRTPLRHVHLRNCTITDDGMRVLLAHKLHSLTMWYCDSVTTQCWPDVLANAQELRSLEIGRYVDLLKHSAPNEKQPIDFELQLPRLQKLRMNAVVLQPSLQFAQLQQLVYLDLTACILAEGFSLEALTGLQRLGTLVLFNVWPLEKEIPAICKLKGLRSLDISTAFGLNGNGIYIDPNRTLETIVTELPLLTHLDISGTNLAGTGVAQVSTSGKVKSSDIPGLMSRVNNPLQFLGLYNTTHSACRRFEIPALMVSVVDILVKQAHTLTSNIFMCTQQISGEANESQILTSAMVYQDRPIMLTKVLNDLYHWLRFECCEAIHCALDVVLLAMDRHVRVKHMQISGR